MKSDLIIPDWIKLKIEKNDQKFDSTEFKKLNFYYKKLTGKPLKKGCVNCIPDAFIVIKIHLKKQNESSN